MVLAESLNSIAMIFIMIIPGIIIKKTGIISEKEEKGIYSIVVNLTWPCLVIDAMQIPFSEKALIQCGYTFIITSCIFMFAIIIAFGLTWILKTEKEKRYIFAFMLIFGNTGFMGMPIINAIYGKEALFYASIVEMVQNIFLFTMGIFLIQMSAGLNKKRNIKDIMTPGIFSVIIGFGLFVLDIELPSFLGESIGIIGSATTPLAMILLGTKLEGISFFKKIVKRPDTYILSFFKLIIIPCIVMFFLIFVLKDTSLLANVIIIDFAMPVAACAFIFSERYNGLTEFTVESVILSTTISILTIPLFVILMKMAFA